MNRRGNREQNKVPATNRIPSGDGREPINVATQIKARHDVVQTQTGVAIQLEIEGGSKSGGHLAVGLSPHLYIGCQPRDKKWTLGEKTRARTLSNSFTRNMNTSPRCLRRNVRDVAVPSATPTSKYNMNG